MILILVLVLSIEVQKKRFFDDPWQGNERLSSRTFSRPLRGGLETKNSIDDVAL